MSNFGSFQQLSCLWETQKHILGMCRFKTGKIITYDQIALRVWTETKHIKTLHLKPENENSKFLSLTAIDSINCFLLTVTVKTGRGGFIQMWSDSLSLIQLIDLDYDELCDFSINPNQTEFLICDIANKVTTLNLLFIKNIENEPFNYMNPTLSRSKSQKDPTKVYLKPTLIELEETQIIDIQGVSIKHSRFLDSTTLALWDTSMLYIYQRENNPFADPSLGGIVGEENDSETPTTPIAPFQPYFILDVSSGEYSAYITCIQKVDQHIFLLGLTDGHLRIFTITRNHPSTSTHHPYPTSGIQNFYCHLADLEISVTSWPRSLQLCPWDPLMGTHSDLLNQKEPSSTSSSSSLAVSPNTSPLTTFRPSSLNQPTSSASLSASFEIPNLLLPSTILEKSSSSSSAMGKFSQQDDLPTNFELLVVDSEFKIFHFQFIKEFLPLSTGNSSSSSPSSSPFILSNTSAPSSQPMASHQSYSYRHQVLGTFQLTCEKSLFRKDPTQELPRNLRLKPPINQFVEPIPFQIFSNQDQDSRSSETSTITPLSGLSRNLIAIIGERLYSFQIHKPYRIIRKYEEESNKTVRAVCFGPSPPPSFKQEYFSTINDQSSSNNQFPLSSFLQPKIGTQSILLISDNKIEMLHPFDGTLIREFQTSNCRLLPSHSESEVEKRSGGVKTLSNSASTSVLNTSNHGKFLGLSKSMPYSHSTPSILPITHTLGESAQPTPGIPTALYWCPFTDLLIVGFTSGGVGFFNTSIVQASPSNPQVHVIQYDNENTQVNENNENDFGPVPTSAETNFPTTPSSSSPTRLTPMIPPVNLPPPQGFNFNSKTHSKNQSNFDPGLNDDGLMSYNEEIQSSHGCLITCLHTIDRPGHALESPQSAAPVPFSSLLLSSFSFTSPPKRTKKSPHRSHRGLSPGASEIHSLSSNSVLLVGDEAGFVSMWLLSAQTRSIVGGRRWRSSGHLGKIIQIKSLNLPTNLSFNDQEPNSPIPSNKPHRIVPHAPSVLLFTSCAAGSVKVWTLDMSSFSTKILAYFNSSSTGVTQTLFVPNIFQVPDDDNHSNVNDKPLKQNQGVGFQFYMKENVFIDEDDDFSPSNRENGKKMKYEVEVLSVVGFSHGDIETWKLSTIGSNCSNDHPIQVLSRPGTSILCLSLNQGREILRGDGFGEKIEFYKKSNQQQKKHLQQTNSYEECLDRTTFLCSYTDGCVYRYLLYASGSLFPLGYFTLPNSPIFFSWHETTNQEDEAHNSTSVPIDIPNPYEMNELNHQFSSNPLTHSHSQQQLQEQQRSYLLRSISSQLQHYIEGICVGRECIFDVSMKSKTQQNQPPPLSDTSQANFSLSPTKTSSSYDLNQHSIFQNELEPSNPNQIGLQDMKSGGELIGKGRNDDSHLEFNLSLSHISASKSSLTSAYTPMTISDKITDNTSRLDLKSEGQENGVQVDNEFKQNTDNYSPTDSAGEGRVNAFLMEMNPSIDANPQGKFSDRLKNIDKLVNNRLFSTKKDAKFLELFRQADMMNIGKLTSSEAVEMVGAWLRIGLPSANSFYSKKTSSSFSSSYSSNSSTSDTLKEKTNESTPDTCSIVVSLLQVLGVDHVSLLPFENVAKIAAIASIMIGQQSNKNSNTKYQTRDYFQMKQFKTKVSYNSMGEKTVSKIENVQGIVDGYKHPMTQFWNSLSTPLVNTQPPTIFSKIKSPTILTSIPSSFQSVLSSELIIPEIWSPETGYWCHPSKAIEIARAIFDQRAILQIDIFHEIQQQLGRNNLNLPLQVHISTIPMILVQYCELHFGSGGKSFLLNQLKTMSMIESCLQYPCPILNILFHCLCPEMIGKNNIWSEASIWFVSETRRILNTIGFRKGKKMDFTKYITDSRTSQEAFHQLIPRTDAYATVIEILKTRGSYGPHFISQVLSSSIKLPSCELFEQLPRNQDNDFIDVEIFLELIGQSFSKAEVILQTSIQHLFDEKSFGVDPSRKPSLKPSAIASSSTTSFQLLPSSQQQTLSTLEYDIRYLTSKSMLYHINDIGLRFIYFDHQRKGEVTLANFKKVMDHLALNILEVSLEQKDYIVLLSTSVSHFAQCKDNETYICYMDLWARLLAWFEQTEGKKLLSCQEIYDSISLLRGLELNHAHELLHFLGMTSTPIHENYLWIINYENENNASSLLHLSRKGHWQLPSTVSNINDLIGNDKVSPITEDKNSKLSLNKNIQQNNLNNILSTSSSSPAILTQKPTTIPSKTNENLPSMISVAKLPLKSNPITQKSNIFTSIQSEEMIPKDAVSNAMRKQPTIQPTTRELYTLHGEICRFPHFDQKNNQFPILHGSDFFNDVEFHSHTHVPTMKNPVLGIPIETIASGPLGRISAKDKKFMSFSRTLNGLSKNEFDEDIQEDPSLKSRSQIETIDSNLIEGIDDSLSRYPSTQDQVKDSNQSNYHENSLLNSLSPSPSLLSPHNGSIVFLNETNSLIEKSETTRLTNESFASDYIQAFVERKIETLENLTKKHEEDLEKEKILLLKRQLAKKGFDGEIPSSFFKKKMKTIRTKTPDFKKKKPKVKVVSPKSPPSGSGTPSFFFDTTLEAIIAKSQSQNEDGDQDDDDELDSSLQELSPSSDNDDLNGFEGSSDLASPEEMSHLTLPIETTKVENENDEQEGENLDKSELDKEDGRGEVGGLGGGEDDEYEEGAEVGKKYFLSPKLERSKMAKNDFNVWDLFPDEKYRSSPVSLPGKLDVESILQERLKRLLEMRDRCQQHNLSHPRRNADTIAKFFMPQIFSNDIVFDPFYSSDLQTKKEALKERNIQEKKLQKAQELKKQQGITHHQETTFEDRPLSIITDFLKPAEVEEEEDDGLKTPEIDHFHEAVYDYIKVDPYADISNKVHEFKKTTRHQRIRLYQQSMSLIPPSDWTQLVLASSVDWKTFFAQERLRDVPPPPVDEGSVEEEIDLLDELMKRVRNTNSSKKNGMHSSSPSSPSSPTSPSHSSPSTSRGILEIKTMSRRRIPLGGSNKTGIELNLDPITHKNHSQGQHFFLEGGGMEEEEEEVQEVDDPNFVLRPLVFGRVTHDILVPEGTLHYQIECFDTESIVTIELTSQRGSANLYIAQKYIPTISKFDHEVLCTPDNKNIAQISLRAPEKGRLYVSVYSPDGALFNLWAFSSGNQNENHSNRKILQNVSKKIRKFELLASHSIESLHVGLPQLEIQAERKVDDEFKTLENSFQTSTKIASKVFALTPANNKVEQIISAAISHRHLDNQSSLYSSTVSSTPSSPLKSGDSVGAFNSLHHPSGSSNSTPRIGLAINNNDNHQNTGKVKNSKLAIEFVRKSKALPAILPRGNIISHSGRSTGRRSSEGTQSGQITPGNISIQQLLQMNSENSDDNEDEAADLDPDDEDEDEDEEKNPPDSSILHDFVLRAGRQRIKNSDLKTRKGAKIDPNLHVDLFPKISLARGNELQTIILPKIHQSSPTTPTITKSKNLNFPSLTSSATPSSPSPFLIPPTQGKKRLPPSFTNLN